MGIIEFQKKFQKVPVIKYENLVPKDPVLSVLVQTYNQEKYIIPTLEGILQQKTDFRFEIILGEDSSMDSTREICRSFAERYPGIIRLLLHDRRNQILIEGKPTPNFNAIYNFYEARGKFCAFCEGDDIWTDPYKLQKQVDFLQKNPGYVFSYHQYITIDEKGNKIHYPEDDAQPLFDINSADLLSVKYHPLLFTICFRNVLKKIPIEMAQVLNVDTFLISVLGNFGGAKYHEDIAPARYRRHAEGIWGKRLKRKKLQLKILTYRKLSTYYRRMGRPQIASIFRKKIINHRKMLLHTFLNPFS